MCGLDVKTQVLRGDLSPHLLAYKISSVSTEKSLIDGVRSISHGMSPDMELYKLILCDLAESFKIGWHTVDTIRLPFELARKSIWTIVLPSIAQEAAEEVDGRTKNFGPYLGATAIDTGNPLHMELFSLVDGAYVHGKNFYYRRELIDNYDEDAAIAESYGASSKPILLDAEGFQTHAPASLKRTSLSERGHLSRLRIEGKSSPTHGQKLAHALLDYLQNNPEIEEFSYKTGSKSVDFICDENKVKNYLLNVDHPDGGPKAKFFIEILGIQREDWRYLADQISGAMSSALIYRVKNNNHGISHGAFIEVIGRNDRKAIIQTGWIVKNGEAPRLVTAYPNSDSVEGEFQAPLQNISPVGLTGDEKWADIYRRAHTAGERAAHACIPTPMTLNDYSPIFGGPCGFAWVTVADARKGMAKWLKDNNIGHKSYKSGWDVPAHPMPNKEDSWDLQSIEPKIAYAKAFGKVLLDNGVECEANSRLD